ncbi:hypothetical protein QWZ13_05945 [Reinekea marina]|uniref:Uncharacterized protein n=1 Tax=Reinekea marina TaxID=1310421 RepID=A0ABV7WQD6_9GAMM|nr:hypothetical protein [Reinekea marina]MDN3648448.1 hypothetical protein [Reinekea marina]
MSIQDIATSNSQKKAILKAINDEGVALQEENGEVIINVEAYLLKYPNLSESPVMQLITDESIDMDADYWVFS